MYNEYSGKLALFSLFIAILMLFVGRRTFIGKADNRVSLGFIFICIALYSILGFAEWDTYHYYSFYNEMYSYNYRLHVEEFYFWLIKVLPHGYLYWRFVIWGLSSYLIIKSSQMMNVDGEMLCFLFPLLALSNLTYTRGSLGITLLLFNYILIIRSIELHKKWLLILGILGGFLSIYLHDSMIAFVAILILSLVIPLNKKTFVISLLIFPILYISVQNLWTFISPLFEKLTENQMELFLSYKESEKAVLNVNGFVLRLIKKGALVGLVFILAKQYLNEKSNQPNMSYQVFKYAYFMVYVSFLFLGQEMSSWISDRILHAGSFALLLAATSGLDTKISGNRRTLFEKLILFMYFAVMLYYFYVFIGSFW